jgi:hypothetical protein
MKGAGSVNNFHVGHNFLAKMECTKGTDHGALAAHGNASLKSRICLVLAPDGFSFLVYLNNMSYEFYPHEFFIF